MNNEFISSIEEIIEDQKLGKMVIMVDDEDRENEGDLIIPASKVDDKAINFMDKDFSPLDDMRASRNYRLTVAKNLLLKAFYEIKDKKNIRIHS